MRYFRSTTIKTDSCKVLVFTAYYLPGYKGGGPIKTIKNLIDSSYNDISFNVVTNDRDLGDSSPYDTVSYNSWNEVGNAEVFYAQSGMISYKQIAKIVFERKYDIIYLNSFFSPAFSWFPLLIAKSLSQKIILGPRGEFSEGALNLKSQKKNAFIKLYKSLGLHHGVVYQASSEYEVNDIKRVLGNHVDVRVAEDIGGQEFAGKILVSDVDQIKAVFVSRISPKKNLLFALEVLKDVKQCVSYDIFGPIEDREYWTKCEKIISTLPSNVQVNYRGELRPEDIVNTISTYDLFFMPTKGENYGHVIAEALCAGLPLLIADTTPWRDLRTKGIGWDLPLDNRAAFSDTIDQLALMSVEEHYQMRKNVLNWAKDKFSQRDAIEANIAMFEYVANK